MKVRFALGALCVEEIDGIGLTGGEPQFVEVDRVCHRGVRSSEINHEFIVDVDEEVIIPLKAEDVTLSIGELHVEFERKMEVVSEIVSRLVAEPVQRKEC